jgi:hypothetical protein
MTAGEQRMDCTTSSAAFENKTLGMFKTTQFDSAIADTDCESRLRIDGRAIGHTAIREAKT